MSKVSQEVPDEHQGHIEIDRGFRSWYESCPCCLSEAYPQVKRRLDDEKVLQAAEEAARQ